MNTNRKDTATVTTATSPIIDTRLVDLDDLQAHPRNPNHGNVKEVAQSIRTNGQFRPIVVRPLDDGKYQILAGHTTAAAMRSLGRSQMLATIVQADDRQAERILLADNRTAQLADMDDELLLELLEDHKEDLLGTGYTDADLEDLMKEPDPGGLRGSLVSRFGAPPLSVLSARGGEWQTRKRDWIRLGLQSELGREGELVYNTPQSKYINWYLVKNAAEQAAGHALSNETIIKEHADELQAPGGGTSVFDPALCELLIAWHSAVGQAIIDPWAGGAVRGIVSGAMGRRYTGIELQERQVDANRAQVSLVNDAVQAGFGVGGDTAGEPVEPTWIVGDSRKVLQDLPDGAFDMALGCPPYYFLERYSDDPNDLSTMTPDEFDAAMADTLAEVSRVLRQDSFAVFIVGSVRAKDGSILDMRRCLENGGDRAGLALVNDAVLLTPVGSAASRAARSFESTRVLARVHQEVLVFVKGNRAAAAKRAGTVQIGSVAEVVEDDAE